MAARMGFWLSGAVLASTTVIGTSTHLQEASELGMRTKVRGIYQDSRVHRLSLCGVGAVAGITVVLIRVPALASTRLELLFGTLQGVAVSHGQRISNML